MIIVTVFFNVKRMTLFYCIHWPFTNEEWMVDWFIYHLTNWYLVTFHKKRRLIMVISVFHKIQNNPDILCIWYSAPHDLWNSKRYWLKEFDSWRLKGLISPNILNSPSIILCARKNVFLANIFYWFQALCDYK